MTLDEGMDSLDMVRMMEWMESGGDDIWMMRDDVDGICPIRENAPAACLPGHARARAAAVDDGVIMIWIVWSVAQLVESNANEY